LVNRNGLHNEFAIKFYNVMFKDQFTSIDVYTILILVQLFTIDITLIFQCWKRYFAAKYHYDIRGIKSGNVLFFVIARRHKIDKHWTDLHDMLYSIILQVTVSRIEIGNLELRFSKKIYCLFIIFSFYDWKCLIR